MVQDINFCVCSYMKYLPWDTTWGKLLTMQVQKDIDWELLHNANCWVHDCDAINMATSQIYIPMWHLKYERVKYPCDTCCMVIIQSQIPLHRLSLIEGSIYNHWLVNYDFPWTRIMTGMTWNIQWRGVCLDITISSMYLQYHCWHWS